MESNWFLRRVLQVGTALTLIWLNSGGVNAATLWSNGAISTSPVNTVCDTGPNTCGNSGGAFWTVFDNFNVPAGSKSWVVTAIDFTDFLINVSAADIGNTQWSIWSGNPLSGGKLVASGSSAASLSLVSGSCGSGNTCIETFTVNVGTPVLLAAGNTYFLGTSNTLLPSNGGETLTRAFAAGGNTAPGGTANALSEWEQSNGSTTGVPNSSWSAGTHDTIFFSGATAFDIQGVLAPEPGTMSLLFIALAGCLCWVRRRPA